MVFKCGQLSINASSAVQSLKTHVMMFCLESRDISGHVFDVLGLGSVWKRACLSRTFISRHGSLSWLWTLSLSTCNRRSYLTCAHQSDWGLFFRPHRAEISKNLLHQMMLASCNRHLLCDLLYNCNVSWCLNLITGRITALMRTYSSDL